MADDRDFEARLREALHREAADRPLRVDAMTVQERLASRSRLPSWLVPVLVPVAAAVVIVAVLLNAFPGPTSDPGSGSATHGAVVTPAPSGSAAPTAQATPAPTLHPAFGRRRAAASGDGLFYVVGGQAGTRQSRSAVVFDGLTWNDLPSLPEGRAGAGAAVLPGGRLAVFGGEIDGLLTDSTLVLEPGADTWIPAVPMPYPQADMAVAALNGRAYLFGGSAIDHGTDVLVFDPSGTGWTVEPMPFPLEDVAVAALGNSIYVVGAPPAADDVVPEAAATALMFRVDPDAGVWTPLASPPIQPLVMAAAGGRIWAIGRPDLEHHGVAFYEPETDAWTLTDQQLPPGRATVVIPSGRILVVIAAQSAGMTMTVIDVEAP